MALDKLGHDVVHEICTNQVVVTLQACVKELVENSLDAGAKRLELRLRESGSELLELVDDGHGISSDNFEKLATRHATSKIREYNDLSQKLTTFGFRGEALSAIAAMGDMTVCTRVAGDATATLLTYDRFGKLVSQVPAAREVGTTVSIRDLFKRLPVRHREFLRNAKAQVNAVLRFIQSYAIAQPEIRFHVLAEKKSGNGAGKATLLSSSGTAKGWRQAAAAILGDAILADVESFELVGGSSGWNVSGLISKPIGGRRSRDTQLFFCNRRPIDPPKRIIKLINDTFHQYNSRQWPLVILSFTAPQNLVDVNVTPDKRTVFFHKEEELLKEVQDKLTALFAPVACIPASLHILSTLGVRPQSSERMQSADIDALAVQSPSRTSADISSRSSDMTAAPLQDAECKTPENPSCEQSDIMQDPRLVSDSAESATQSQQADVEMETPEKLIGRPGGSMLDSQYSGPADPFASLSSADAEFQLTELTTSTTTQVLEFKLEDDAHQSQGMSVVQYEVLESMERANDSSSQSAMVPEFQVQEIGQESLTATGSEEVLRPDEPMEFVALDYTSMPQLDTTNASSLRRAQDTEAQQDVVPFAQDGPEDVDMVGALPPPPAHIASVRINVSMAQLEAASARRRQQQTPRGAPRFCNPGSDTPEEKGKIAEACMQFPSAFSLSSLRPGKGRATLDEVATFGAAEEAASTNAGAKEEGTNLLKFDKSCFSKMRVIGQFNLGFIIASLRTQAKETNSEDLEKTDDVREHQRKPSGLQLFIIDQHASDEKYRFEKSNYESKIDRQPLVSPHVLQLNPAQEQLAKSHLEIFRLNGFDIKSDESRPPGRRLQLASLPSCQGLIFGEKDIHDLLYTLEQAEVPAAEKDQSQELQIKDEQQKGVGLLDLAGHRGGWSSRALPRPKKVWQLLACRACRGAIMIGKALRVHEMERVLANLGTLQQPYNCPHGRPTMRHLIDTGAAWQEPRRSPPLKGRLGSPQS
mmetsp:Transcript_100846/g.157532  ORF Transcript_100846/g.157532 Transcript_100846/m.157532 type:complete len:984 (-) Transcript_100846:72-3023(-)